MSCRCPASRAGRNCEHMAALMYAVEAAKEAKESGVKDEELLEKWKKMDEELRQEEARAEEEKKQKKRQREERKRQQEEQKNQQEEKKRQREERKRQQEEQKVKIRKYVFRNDLPDRRAGRLDRRVATAAVQPLLRLRSAQARFGVCLQHGNLPPLRPVRLLWFSSQE